MASIKLTGDTSGEITISAPAVAGTHTLTLPANTGNIVTTGDSGTVTQGMIASGVTGTGPAFSAYMSSDQSVATATFTKLAINAEEFDSNGNYDTSLYRFTPNVEGHYQVNFQACGQTITSGQFLISIFQNGSEIEGVRLGQVNGQGDTILSGSTVIYCNGTTDYLDFYVYQNTGANKNILGQYRYTRASAFLARKA